MFNEFKKMLNKMFFNNCFEEKVIGSPVYARFKVEKEKDKIFKREEINSLISLRQ